MNSFFYRGQFDGYKVPDLKPAYECVEIPVSQDSFPKKIKTTVFLSHKHDDLNDLKGVIGMLEKEFDVKVYIDSWDKKMPEVTSGQTADRIKNKIKECDKFILLATNAAIESNWCNWELGYGDAQKNEYNNLALFPMEDVPKSSSYKGNEYLEIYPHIISKENQCYVKFQEEITPLSEWFSR